MLNFCLKKIIIIKKNKKFLSHEETPYSIIFEFKNITYCTLLCLIVTMNLICNTYSTDPDDRSIQRSLVATATKLRFYYNRSKTARLLNHNSTVSDYQIGCPLQPIICMNLSWDISAPLFRNKDDSLEELVTGGFSVCREYYLTSWIQILMMQVCTCWAFWDLGEKIQFLVKKHVFSMFQRIYTFFSFDAYW